jgi:hypothetical protein
LVLASCGKRPPEVTEANEFKRELLVRAIKDKGVRDAAYQKTLKDVERAKLNRQFEANMALTRNVEQVDGVPHVYFLADGKKIHEPLDQFILRVIALKEANAAKLEAMELKEDAEDAKVDAKLAAVLKLDILTEEYQRAVDTKTVGAQDLNKLIAEVIATVKPLIQEE